MSNFAVSPNYRAKKNLKDLADLELTQGDILYFDGNNLTKLSPGTNGQYLKTQGVGANPVWSDVSGGGGDIGGNYGINVETLSGDKTLTPGTDKMYQYLDPNGANRVITLDTSNAEAGDRFVIRNNGAYDTSYYLEISDGTNTLDYIYAGAIKEFIFDGTNWVSAENGTGENDDKKYNVAIGRSTRGYISGTAVGYSAYGYNYGAAVGYNALGYSCGAAVGYNALGYSCGTAVGYSAYGYTFGTAVGYSAYGNNYGVAIGRQSKGRYKGLSIGYQAGYNLSTYANPNKNILIGYKAGYNLKQPSAWAASTDYSVGDYVRPTSANGYNYECISAGTSGSSEPTWPTTIGDTVTDGGVTWRCVSMRGNNNIIIGYDIEGSEYDADTLNIGNTIKGRLDTKEVQFQGSAGFVLNDLGTVTADTTIDWRDGNKAKITLGANITLSFTNPGAPCNLVLEVVQDGTGGRTITWPSNVKWAGGNAPTLSTDANAVDIIAFYFDGTNYYGQASLNFS